VSHYLSPYLFSIVLLFMLIQFKTTLARKTLIIRCFMMPVKIQNNRFLSEIENCREKICLSAGLMDECLPYEIDEAAISRGELTGGRGRDGPVVRIVAVVGWDLSR